MSTDKYLNWMDSSEPLPLVHKRKRRTGSVPYDREEWGGGEGSERALAQFPGTARRGGGASERESTREQENALVMLSAL